MEQTKEDILLILYNRQKRGISMEELILILNTPELLEKERKLARHKINLKKKRI